MYGRAHFVFLGIVKYSKQTLKRSVQYSAFYRVFLIRIIMLIHENAIIIITTVYHKIHKFKCIYVINRQ